MQVMQDLKKATHRPIATTKLSESRCFNIPLL